MSGEELRERILGQLAYTDVQFPRGKTIRVLPYISGKAMDSYIARAADPGAAFQHMVADSTEVQPEDAPQLLEDEAEVIACLYASKGGFLDAYVEERKTKDVFQSFFSAFSATEFWLNWKRTTAQLQSQLDLHTKLLPTRLDLIPTDLNRIIANTQRLAVPTFQTPNVAAWLGTRSIALQVAATNFLPNVTSIQHLSTLASINLESWTRLTNQPKWTEEFGELLGAHSSYINALSQRTATASQILLSHAHVFNSFNKLAAALPITTPNIEEHLKLAGIAFTGSDELVRTANDFFLQEPQRPVPIRESARLNAIEALRSFEIEEQIQEVAERSEGLFHATVGQAILLGNELLPMLQEIVGSAFDERLKPYLPILERMNLLASPKSFHETLKAFAVVFQRDHWKDLWSELGKKYKSRPEGIARMALSMFLQGHCQGTAFVGKELGNGDGYVDLLVNYLGLDYVVEVKIIGATWSLTDAKSGLGQLDAYIQNYGDAKGYLIVFDGRVSGKGEQLQAEYKLNSGATVQVLVIKSYFDKPSS